MPVYQFRCPSCGPFDAVHTMAAVPDSGRCPACGADARRAITAAALGRGSSPRMAAIDAAARSASEPAVVTGAVPGRRPGPAAPVSQNPLHRRLPRP